MRWSQRSEGQRAFYERIFSRRRLGRVAFEEGTSKNPNQKGAAPVTDLDEANVVLSSLGSGHMPVLDLDYEAFTLPSSTPGHYHLYLNKKITWAQYIQVLTALSAAELIEPGFAGASIKRGYSAVRLPWVKKEKPKP